MKRSALFCCLLATASPALARPYTVSQVLPTYTDAHPLKAPDAAAAYAYQPADIPSNFTASTWYHVGSPPGPNGQYSAPGVGSEAKARFDCNVAGHNNDDPIIFPGVAGGSPHEHTTFGNLAFANSMYNATYSALRGTGNSTCYGGPLNRTLYWEPSVKRALTNGSVVTKKPKNIVTYYEVGVLADIGTGKITDPLVASVWPRQIEFIEGINPSDPTNTRAAGIVSALNAAAGWAHYSIVAPGTGGGFVGWNCFTTVSGPSSAAYLRNSDGSPTLNCQANTDIYAELLSDPCWDGVNFTSPNGRLHMMPYLRDNNTGKNVCPDNWVRVVQFRAKVTFTQTGQSDYTSWWLSSDRMSGMTQFRNGETMHFDLIPAWEYGTTAAPGAFLIFANHCDGLSITQSGTTLTGDAHECGYARISLTQNLYVNEASPDSSLPNPLVVLSPDESNYQGYFAGATGNPVPGTIHNCHATVLTGVC